MAFEVGALWSVFLAIAGVLVGWTVAAVLARMRRATASEARRMSITGGGLGAALGVFVVPWLPIGARAALALFALVGGAYSVGSSSVQNDFLAALVEEKFSAEAFETRAETELTPVLRWTYIAGAVLFVCASAAAIALLALWVFPRVTGFVPW